MVRPERVAADPLTLLRTEPSWAQAYDDAIRASLPELSQFMPWATEEHGLDQSREFLERAVLEWDAGEAWHYSLLDSSGRLVGSAGLMTRMGAGILEIGYWVHSQHTGRGYASAAATTLGQLGVETEGVERVVIRHDVANPASGRVAAHAGFVEVDREDYEPVAPGQAGVMVVWERRP